MSEAARERILNRISMALKRKSPRVVVQPHPIFPPVADLRPRFELECKHNNTECIFTSSMEETQSRLLDVIASLEPGSLFAEDMPFIRDRLRYVPRDLNWSTAGAAPESCQATITRCKALIAATGSLLVTSSCGGRRGSIVAPVHVVLARESQLLPDIESALALAEKTGDVNKNSFLAVVTGCSRTADIEKLLVIGAHGPKRLVVFVEK